MFWTIQSQNKRAIIPITIPRKVGGGGGGLSLRSLLGTWTGGIVAFPNLTSKQNDGRLADSLSLLRGI